MESIANKTIVFTGKLEQVTRREAEEQARKLGAKVGSRVTKDTALLVAGPGSGLKMKDATQQGVKVIDEAAWLEIVKAEGRMTP